MHSEKHSINFLNLNLFEERNRMNNHTPNILESLRQLILRSCAFEELPSKEFQNFHADFLKFSFSAIFVKIDYTSQSIFLWNYKPMGKNPLDLYDLNSAVSETISYTNLEETLLGCIEKGEFHKRFYRHLLFEYSNFTTLDGDDDDKVQSA